jgi:prepilin-type N-terminal cleavage/methylation domain-containing protein
MTSARGNERRRRFETAFTLIELLVVMALIALLGGLSAGAFQVARRNYALAASAGKIQGVLRAARNTSISTGTRSFVVIDPVRRTVTAQSFETAGEWSFEDLGEDQSAFGGASPVRLNGARVGPGRVGKGLDFRGASGAHADCGNQPSYNVRVGLIIEAWVRHGLEEPVRPPAAERRRQQRQSLSARRNAADDDPLYAIVVKEGAYFLGMTRAGALEAGVGSYRARTADGVVAPSRWVFVSLLFDGQRLEVAADGVARELEPLVPASLGASAPDPVPPAEVPVSPAPLTISAPSQPFPGEIDEVRLRGRIEPLAYSYPEHEHIAGWKKVIHFDRRGNLDPAYHERPVRIVLLELPEEEYHPSKTVAVVDFSRTFEEWLEDWRNAGGSAPALDQAEEEAKIEQRFAAARKVVIEIDNLGVVR